MKLVSIDREHFAQWKDYRDKLYDFLDDSFNEKEMEQTFYREDWFCYFLADEQDRIFGLVELSSRNIVDGCLSSPVAYLEGLFLEKEYRHKGMGKQALTIIKAWCKEKGYKELATDAELDNVDAQQFYQALGFQETYRVVEFRIDVK